MKTIFHSKNSKRIVVAGFNAGITIRKIEKSGSTLSPSGNYSVVIEIPFCTRDTCNYVIEDIGKNLK
jgi:hypothetical protein